MNREIKFKFWNKKNSRFLQNDNNSIDKTIFDLWDWVEVMGTCTSFPMGDYVFVQCTGSISSLKPAGPKSNIPRITSPS